MTPETLEDFDFLQLSATVDAEVAFATRAVTGEMDVTYGVPPLPRCGACDLEAASAAGGATSTAAATTQTARSAPT
jgi:hypothetical protein